MRENLGFWSKSENGVDENKKQRKKKKFRVPPQLEHETCYNSTRDRTAKLLAFFCKKI